MFKLIVAVDLNHGIGKSNHVPWDDPEDRQYFKSLTQDSAIIMGRKTFESLGRPLPNRINMVISSTLKVKDDSVMVFPSLSEALTEAQILYGNNVWIIGGSQIYYEALTRFLHLCLSIHYTVITSIYPCDVFFPQGGNIPQLVLNTGNKFNVLNLNQILSPEQPYLDVLQKALQMKEVRPDRTGKNTLSIFGPQMVFSLQGVLPIITTKKVWIRAVIEELLLFVSGKCDTQILADKQIGIWKKNTSKEFLEKRGLSWEQGDMGPSYGHQWRHWGAEYRGCREDYTGKGIDQLQQLVDGIKIDPFGRRHILSAWNVTDLDRMALPPCHCFVQFYVSTCKRYLDCMLYQRSGDLFLGVPFNLTSYALLTYMLGHLCGLEPRTLYYNLGDAHIYLDHMEAVKIQLTRKPYPFPILKIQGNPQRWEDFKVDSFKIREYRHHPTICGEMAI